MSPILINARVQDAPKGQMTAFSNLTNVDIYQPTITLVIFCFYQISERMVVTEAILADLLIKTNANELGFV